MNYDKQEPIKISVEGGLSPDRTLQLTMHPHATLEEWIDTFKTILIHQTFAEDTVKDLFEPPCYDNYNNEYSTYDEKETSCARSKWKQEF